MVILWYLNLSDYFIQGRLTSCSESIFTATRKAPSSPPPPTLGWRSSCRTCSSSWPASLTSLAGARTCGADVEEVASPSYNSLSVQCPCRRITDVRAGPVLETVANYPVSSKYNLTLAKYFKRCTIFKSRPTYPYPTLSQVFMFQTRPPTSGWFPSGAPPQTGWRSSTPS